MCLLWSHGPCVRHDLVHAWSSCPLKDAVQGHRGVAHGAYHRVDGELGIRGCDLREVSNVFVDVWFWILIGVDWVSKRCLLVGLGGVVAMACSSSM